jgi:rare lipoprotein A
MSRLGVVLSATLLLTAQLPMHATAGQPRSFSGLAAYYSGRGGGLTAAHRTLPIGTRVRVTDPKTGRSVVVTINDRGPFGGGRVLDLCTSAARSLGMISRGVIYVKADVLPP